MHLSDMNPIIRFSALISCILLVYGLFHHGAQPMAVGLFAPPVDKIAHAAVFGLMAVMLWLALNRQRPFLIILLVVLTGAADEIHQLFLPGRSADMSDWIADITGACLTVIALMTSKNKPRAQAPAPGENWLFIR